MKPFDDYAQLLKSPCFSFGYRSYSAKANGRRFRRRNQAPGTFVQDVRQNLEFARQSIDC